MFFLVIRKNKTKQPTARPGGVQLDSGADAWRFQREKRADGYDG